MKTISACIPTYKRPELLRKLIDSLLNQNLPGGIKLEIIIADNDSKESAKIIFEEYQHLGENIKYYVQPLKNISITRNLTVEKSSGEILYFVDDDEFADPDCLFHLYETMINYKADVVFGRIKPDYNQDVPEWIKKGNFFNRKEEVTGSFPKNLKTGNCIVKRSVVEKFEKPFNEQFGLTGGEDSHLFRKLFYQNSKFVFCSEAVVYEYYPQNRTNFLWLIKRSFRTGNSFTRSRLEIFQNKISLKILYFLKAVLFFTISFIMAILFLPIRSRSTFWLMKASGNAGHAFAVFGFHYKEYK